MMQTAQALQTFFSQFDIPAYVESTEPAGEGLPYITYELVNPDWTGRMTFHANVWYRDTSFLRIANKVDEIRAFIGNGLSIKTESGAVRIWADDAWAQFVPMDGDPTLKRAYLSMIIECHTN